MHLQIAKWGNSLAMRLPAEVVRSFAFTIRPAAWSRRAFAAELAAAREALPMGQSVLEQLRGDARY